MPIKKTYTISLLCILTHRCKVTIRVSRRWTLGSKDSQEKKKRFDVVLIDEQMRMVRLKVFSELMFRKGLMLKEIFLKNSSSTFKERNISMLQGSLSIERNMKDISLRTKKTLLQIVQMLNANSVGQVFTCEAIIYDIVHDFAPFYKYQLKARIRDDTESTVITIFGDEAEELLKHPASELEKLIESENGIQTVKSIIDKIIGASIVFEIKISQYNIQSQGRYGFTAKKVFQVDYKLDSHQIQEQIEQVTESSQILNNTFQSHPPDNIHKNNSTLMKKK
ncbi:hypothetical protein IFM89_033979, partial [Coptis chinensis]